MELTPQQIDDLIARLSPDDERVLISLPYRAGMYVSHADITGGWEAQEKELQSLQSILRQFTEDFCKTPFAQKILMDCAARRGQWPAWAQKIDKVPEEAGHIVGLLAPHLPAGELTGFKQALVEIALAVAMAFREEAEEKPVERGALREVIDFLIGGEKNDGDPLSHANISPAERTALSRFCDAIGYIG